MRAIDFTHTGGFPLTQEGLDHLQQAYTECISAFGELGNNGTTPAIVTGMESSIPTPGSLTVTDGWFFYNGEMVKFTGSTVTPTGTDVPLVLIAQAFTTLTYNDGSTHPAVSNKTAALTTGPSATSVSQFPYSAAKPYQLFFGLGGREANWSSLSVLTTPPNGNVMGTIYYKKNWLTNTLHIQAALTVNSAQTLAASPSALNVLVGTLPAAYFPNVNAYFTAYYYAANLFKDDLGVSWVKHLTAAVNTAGQVFVNFIRPDIAITAYSVVFNTILPLD